MSKSYMGNVKTEFDYFLGQLRVVSYVFEILFPFVSMFANVIGVKEKLGLVRFCTFRPYLLCCFGNIVAVFIIERYRRLIAGKSD